ncbi:RNase H domain-containing protein [Trichonephila clavipes]|nr:RNase H domain-containing protein [Trichonephila clavipes]
MLVIYRSGHLLATAPAGVFFTYFQQLSDRHLIHLQWVPSHVGLLGNEGTDDLAKAATSNPVDPEDHMVLTLTKIYFRNKELICRAWVGYSCTPMVLSKTFWIRHIVQGFQIISNGILTIFDWSPEVHGFLGWQSFFSSAHSAMSAGFPLRWLLHPPCSS